METCRNKIGIVRSVNGQSGDIIISEPKKVSELENDVPYLSKVSLDELIDPIKEDIKEINEVLTDKADKADLNDYNKTDNFKTVNDQSIIGQGNIEIKYFAGAGISIDNNNVISNIFAEDVIIVEDSLPETGIENRLYLVPSKVESTKDTYIGYIWTENSWKQVGQDIDLTVYYTKTEIDEITGNIEQEIEGVSGGVSEVDTKLDNFIGEATGKIDDISTGLSTTYDEVVDLRNNKADIRDLDEYNKTNNFKTINNQTVIGTGDIEIKYLAGTNIEITDNNTINNTYNLFTVSDSLPESGVTNKLYLVKTADPTVFVGYVWFVNGWLKVGQEINLTNYYTKGEVDILVNSAKGDAQLVDQKLENFKSNQSVKNTEFEQGIDNLNTKVDNNYADLQAVDRSLGNAIDDLTIDLDGKADRPGVWIGSQEEYDILPIKEENTYYFIYEQEGPPTPPEPTWEWVDEDFGMDYRNGIAVFDAEIETERQIGSTWSSEYVKIWTEKPITVDYDGMIQFDIRSTYPDGFEQRPVLGVYLINITDRENPVVEGKEYITVYQTDGWDTYSDYANKTTLQFDCFAGNVYAIQVVGRENEQGQYWGNFSKFNFQVMSIYQNRTQMVEGNDWEYQSLNTLNWASGVEPDSEPGPGPEPEPETPVKDTKLYQLRITANFWDDGGEKRYFYPTLNTVTYEGGSSSQTGEGIIRIEYNGGHTAENLIVWTENQEDSALLTLKTRINGDFPEYFNIVNDEGKMICMFETNKEWGYRGFASWLEPNVNEDLFYTAHFDREEDGHKVFVFDEAWRYETELKYIFKCEDNYILTGYYSAYDNQRGINKWADGTLVEPIEKYRNFAYPIWIPELIEIGDKPEPGTKKITVPINPNVYIDNEGKQDFITLFDIYDAETRQPVGSLGGNAELELGREYEADIIFNGLHQYWLNDIQIRADKEGAFGGVGVTDTVEPLKFGDDSETWFKWEFKVYSDTEWPFSEHTDLENYNFRIDVNGQSLPYVDQSSFDLVLKPYRERDYEDQDDKVMMMGLYKGDATVDGELIATYVNNPEAGIYEAPTVRMELNTDYSVLIAGDFDEGTPNSMYLWTKAIATSWPDWADTTWMFEFSYIEEIRMYIWKFRTYDKLSWQDEPHIHYLGFKLVLNR